MFREQVGTVSTWFDRWTPCEQTVALVALLRRLQPTQARFLTAVLHRQLVDCGDLRRAEILANDPSFVASLASTESKESLIRDLLAYLPLLNPKNSEVKNIYIGNLIPKVLKYTLDHCALMEEARQLLSYSLIHPAFTVEDRGLFARWLHEFEEMLNQGEMLNTTHTNGGSSNEALNHYPSSLSGSPPSMNDDFSNGWFPSNNNNSNSLSGSPSQGGLILGNFGSSNFPRIRRSNSLTPPVLHSDVWNSQEELFSTGKPRSLSLSSEVSPQSSLASGSGSGSESHLDDPRPTFTSPGMKDVPSWLKSLRLHKYSFLFAHITFEEMMGLTEERLESQGVTKGARHKIVLSIGKLKERAAHLKQLYEEMTADKESIRNVLSEVKWMLTTPMKPSPQEGDEGSNNPTTCINNSNNSSNMVTKNVNTENQTIGPIGSNRFQEEKLSTSESNDVWQAVNARNRENESNLPALIVRVIGKVCELNPDIECEGLLVSVLDKCLSYDAFTYKQKRLLSLWRQQQAPIARRNSIGHHSHFHGHMRRNTTNSDGNSCSGNTKHNRHFSPRVLTLGNQCGNISSSTPQSWSPGSSIHAMFMAKRPSLQDSILELTVHKCGTPVQRTKSAPLPNFFSSLSCSPPISNFDQFDQLSSSPCTTNTTTSTTATRRLASSGIGIGNRNNCLGGLDFSSAGLLGGNLSTGIGSGNTQQQNSSAQIASRLESLSVLEPNLKHKGLGQQHEGNWGMDRLESLCLSMTEAALGPAFNSY